MAQPSDAKFPAIATGPTPLTCPANIPSKIRGRADIAGNTRFRNPLQPSSNNKASAIIAGVLRMRLCAFS